MGLRIKFPEQLSAAPPAARRTPSPPTLPKSTSWKRRTPSSSSDVTRCPLWQPQLDVPTTPTRQPLNTTASGHQMPTHQCGRFTHNVPAPFPQLRYRDTVHNPLLQFKRQHQPPILKTWKLHTHQKDCTSRITRAHSTQSTAQRTNTDYRHHHDTRQSTPQHRHKHQHDMAHVTPPRSHDTVAKHRATQLLSTTRHNCEAPRNTSANQIKPHSITSTTAFSQH